MPLTHDRPDEALVSLHERAEELARVIALANRVPDDFPRAQLTNLAGALQALDRIESEQDKQTLVYAQAKLRETRSSLRDGSYELERAHNALFAEIDTLLAMVPRQELIQLAPTATEPTQVLPRAELERKIAALEQRVDLMDATSRRPITLIDQSTHIDNSTKVELSVLRIRLDALIKLAATIKTELTATLIDLRWFAKLIEGVQALTKQLGKAIEDLRPLVAELAELPAALDAAKRAGQRVVAGGKALFRTIRRKLLGSQSVGAPSILASGTVFRDLDAPWCPEMVVIPAGEFLMGSPEDEEGRDDNEGPQHWVVISQPFALGRYPVTFEEYDHFCAETGRAKPRDVSWGRGRRPAINVSWEDAQAYCAWLAKATGQPYRLPSEAEWEYACRAGTTSAYSWGDKIGPENANFDGNVGKTTYVDSYPANRFRLHDMHGNVWEWCEDRWHLRYRRAPADGRPWTSGKKTSRVVRGGSWGYDPGNLRSASRYRNEPDYRGSSLGFRVCRTITL